MANPFIINLSKSEEGLIFHSIQQISHLPNKNKKAKASLPARSNQPKMSNRLIREIQLITDKPFPADEPINNNQVHVEQEQIRNQIQLTHQQQDIDCEIKRSNDVMNCPAKWFSLKCIHQIQVNHFPEFYEKNSYKTPQLYQSYRNFVVEAFLTNPKRYLTFIACRRVLRGDVNTLLKIFNFLQYHGIINYNIFIEGNYTFKPTSQDKIAQLAVKPQVFIKKLPQTSDQQVAPPIDTDNLTVTVINKHFSRTFRVYCSKCKLICGIAWFTSTVQQETQSNLCFECYNNLDSKAKQQFVKTDLLKKIQISKQNKSHPKTSWGLQDNIKLLEFMGKNQKSNWSDMLQQFQNKKSLEDIIIQFMQFPITNFSPKDHFKELKSEQIQQKEQEHISMLLNLYQKSQYSVKKLEMQQKNLIKVSNVQNFKNYSSKLIEKYVDKINHLYSLENIMEQTNLNTNQQLLCKRIKVNPEIQIDQNLIKGQGLNQDQQ